jgi:23S rRNA pseudouridine2604 synthase
MVNKPPGWLDGLQDIPTRRQPAPHTVRSLLDLSHHSPHDASGVRPLKRHFNALEASVPLETGASGLVVFTQDFRTQRKLVEDMAFMEHELVVDVRGEVFPDDLRPIERALKDERLRLPFAKVSVGSATPERSKLRLAVKGAHPGLAAYLCELAKFEMLAMRRTRLGRVSLSGLEEGTWRYMAPGERF